MGDAASNYQIFTEILDGRNYHVEKVLKVASSGKLIFFFHLK